MPDFRGGPQPLEFGGGPGWPQPAQAAQQLPPSLLQMAQGQAPPMMGDDRGGGGFGGGPGPESDPMGNITAGAPPAYNPGTTFGGYNAVFDPRAPSSTGGWFKMDDYFNQAPVGDTMPTRQPRAGATNNQAMSTNNWRLLPQGFNNPDNFMYNGNIVSRAKARTDLNGPGVMGQEGGGFPGYWPYGGGTWATPVSSYGWTQGPIGGLSGWGMSSTPTY